MSHKQKIDPAQQQLQSLQAVRAPSVGEAALTSDATSLMDAIHSGDYTTRPKNVFFNFSDPAQRNEQRRMQLNAGAQGVSALGAPDVNLLAMNNQNLNDEWARDTAGQYEQDWSNAGVRAAGELGDVAGLSNARNLGALSSTTSMYNNRPAPWWKTILDASARGASTAAMAA